MSVRTVLLLALAITGPGCQSAEEQRAQLSGFYRLGMSRAQLTSLMQRKPFESGTRPPSGWKGHEKDLRLSRVAAWFEGEHGTVVVHCDVYFVPRNWFGVYFDYVFFDEFECLIGFHRRFMD